ncbi:hypothetical protein AUQ48_16665 [Kocuria flava]|uniref:Uncharacterized protein n=1 Tax=Kocuria flava TaxID=446860 RepID=A0A2N4SXI8_9MICC|nr:hypothetical protein [Kocuria flava]PLC10691.1 hypothetical protein AUQ48_16665 [Kocuria flava]
MSANTFPSAIPAEPPSEQPRQQPKLTAPVTIECLTPAGVAFLTGLEFQKITARSELPTVAGVYAWSTDWDAGNYYNGCAAGVEGLRGRVAQQMSQRDLYRADLTSHTGPKLDNGRYVWWNPLVKFGVEMDLVPFVAPIAPAPSWVDELVSLGCLAPEHAPKTVTDWEAFIFECSRLLTGHRSLLGGNASWSSSSTSQRMTVAAEARLKWLEEQGLLDEGQLF